MTSAEAHQDKRLMLSLSALVRAPAKCAFAPILKIGGKTGWYYANWLWHFRGSVDQLLGGVGMSRGRKDDERVEPGDVIDCWRVENIDQDCRLRLVAEMRLPGRAWLEFEVAPQGDMSLIRQTATFDAVGLVGLLYWYGLYPIHRIIFVGMLRRIARAAEAFVPACEGSAGPSQPSAGLLSTQRQDGPIPRL